MRTPDNTPSPSEVVRKLTPLKGMTFSEISRITNKKFTESLGHKGGVGHFVEDVAGLPRGNDRLDFRKEVAELKSKTFHLGCLLEACVIGSINGLATEMIDEDVPFEYSGVGEKCFNTVLVTVCTNRRGGGPCNEGWENFTLETVDTHPLREMSEWKEIVEDWEYLKEYVRDAAFSDGFVSSSAKGPNDYLCFNPMKDSFSYKGRPLRKGGGGLQLALGKTLMRRLYS